MAKRSNFCRVSPPNKRRTTIPTTRVKTITEKEVEEPQGRPGVGDGFSYLAGLSDDELASTRVRIYRRQPTNDGFIGQLSSDPEDGAIQRITEKWIEKTFGGGRYDMKIETKGGAEGYVGGIVIAGEPKLRSAQAAAQNNHGESELAKAFAASVEAQNKLLEKLVDRDSDDRRSASSANASAIESTVKMMESASNRAIEVVAAQVPKQQGNSMVETITLLKELGVIGGEKKDGGIRETLSLLKDLGIVAPQSQAKTIVDQLKDLSALKEFFAGEDGGGKGSGKTNWLDVIEAAIEKSPQVLDRVMFMANENMRRKQAAAAQQASSPSAPSQLPPNVVEAQAAAAQPSAPPPPAAAADPDEPFKRRVLQHVTDNLDPIVTLQFIEGWNPQVAAMLHVFSVEQIRGFLASDPILKQAFDVPTFEQWFVAFLDEIEQDKQEAEEAGQPVKKVN